MDDFEMTPAEWEAFLQRATVENLFEKCYRIAGRNWWVQKEFWVWKKPRFGEARLKE